MQQAQRDTQTPRVRLYSMADAATQLGLSRSFVYILADKNEIATVKVGRRRLVPEEALAEYVERLSDAENNDDR